MQSKTLTTVIAVAGSAIFGAGEANAIGDVFTWKAEARSTAWTDSNNWTVVRDGIGSIGDSSYPGEKKVTDQAVIVDTSGGRYENDPVMSSTLSNAVAILTVNTDGSLTVSGTMTVTGDLTINGYVTVSGTIAHQGVLTIAYDTAVDNGVLLIGTGGTYKMLGAQTHSIGGLIELRDKDSVLLVSADVTLDPYDDGGTIRYGVVSGEDDAAQFKIDEPSSGDNQVLNNITVAGNMWIKIGKDAAGTATFKNGASGIVQADVEGGTLKFGANVVLDDDSGALWKARMNSSAVLQFHKAATGLVGDFIVDDCAKLSCLANITTCGDLTDDAGSNYSGTVDASAGGVCFDWDCAGTPSKICNSTASSDC